MQYVVVAMLARPHFRIGPIPNPVVIAYSHTNLTTLASAVPEIFKGV